MVKYTNKPIAITGPHPVRGFTMLEIIVVLAIAAILAMGTIPSLKDAIERNGRESAMQNLITAISVARTEAVTQGRTVAICRSINQAACAASTGGDWDDGWIIFSDTGVAGTLDGTDALVRVYGPSNDQSVIKLQTRTNGTFASDYLQFNSDGFLKNSSTPCSHCPPQPSPSPLRQSVTVLAWVTASLRA